MNKLPPGIASAYDTLATVQIPDDWSAEQALAVYEFINEIAQLVWDRYEVQLLELIRPELYGEDSSQPDFDGDIPF